MRAAEIVRVPLFEMAFDRPVAEAKIRGREETINEHLIKLLAFEVPDPTREYWRKELQTKHFNFLAAIRVKPKAKLLPSRDWLRWLYSDPFVGNEQGYTEALISRYADEYPRNDRSAAEIASRIQKFHRDMSVFLARGEAGSPLVTEIYQTPWK
jgi:hypothetical protein